VCGVWCVWCVCVLCVSGVCVVRVCVCGVCCVYVLGVCGVCVVGVCVWCVCGVLLLIRNTSCKNMSSSSLRIQPFKSQIEYTNKAAVLSISVKKGRRI